MCTNMAVMVFVIRVSQDWRSREWKPSSSDARVQISGFTVMVQRFGEESRSTATGSVNFFVAFCLNSANALVLQYASLVNHSVSLNSRESVSLYPSPNNRALSIWVKVVKFPARKWNKFFTLADWSHHVLTRNSRSLGGGGGGGG